MTDGVAAVGERRESCEQGGGGQGGEGTRVRECGEGGHVTTLSPAVRHAVWILFLALSQSQSQSLTVSFSLFLSCICERKCVFVRMCVLFLSLTHTLTFSLV